MKNVYLILIVALLSLKGIAQVQTATFTISPQFFNAEDEITITVSGVDPAIWGVSDIYLWTWYYDLDDEAAGDSPTNGTWANSNESQKFSNNGNGTFSYTLTPSILFGDPNIGKIGMLAKADNGTGDKKTQDFLVEVGSFQVILNAPTEPNTIVDAGSDVSIIATSSVTANFELFANGNSILTQNNTTTFSTNYTVNEDSYFELVAIEPNSGDEEIKNFNVILTPNPQELPVPNGMSDGINWNENNPSEATLVLYAPNKEFVHIIGNFNNTNWVLSNSNLLNKDTNQDRFWITLTNLDNGDPNILFQYLVDAEITVADPYSTYVLNDFDDDYIPETTFPNIPDYPSDKTSYAVSWFNIDETAYDWQITDFERPQQEDLVIYEMLIRDFVGFHSYEAVMNHLNYLERLNINVIELMPVSEFDGNISWGYNPGFHMALDKYYGDKNSFKAFVDECHSRGIAVILDVVYNHATGQNPYYRMWNDCNGCYGGQATSENPIFNVEDPNTSFQFFNDINHESSATQDYVDRLNEYWLSEFNIDGYRFDFTKGFTNTVGDGGNYDPSRISILKRMYDEIREIDPTAYVILEHFAPNSEETELIEYRATGDPQEPEMLVWSNHNHNYNEATMGFNTNSDFSWISYLNRGWETPSSVGYMESHDEERLNYKNQEYGNENSEYNIKDLEIALDRLELAGAFYFTIPGPKMIWQFGELGYDYSINYCQNGTINSDCRVDPKPIAWHEDYHNNTERTDVYNIWRQFIGIKLTEPIFKTNNFTLDVGNTNGLKKIQLEDPNANGNEIKYVTILGNFDIVEKEINPQFQENGSWYNMIDGSEITVVNVNDPILLQPGEYLLYANEVSHLNNPDFNVDELIVYPNPSKSIIQFNKNIDEIFIYSVMGKLIQIFTNYSANESISINHLKSGLYFIEGKVDDKIYNLKIIKN